jgi:hypothetical protein
VTVKRHPPEPGPSCRIHEIGPGNLRAIELGRELNRLESDSRGNLRIHLSTSPFEKGIRT